LEPINDDELSDLTPLDSDSDSDSDSDDAMLHPPGSPAPYNSVPGTIPSQPPGPSYCNHSQSGSSQTRDPLVGEAGRTKLYNRKRRSRRRTNARLNLRKLQEKEGHKVRTYKVSSSVSKKYARPRATATSFNIATLPRAVTSYVGKRIPASQQCPWTVDQLVEMGFEVHPWDGRCVS
jgi:hypothetical protein